MKKHLFYLAIASLGFTSLQAQTTDCSQDYTVETNDHDITEHYGFGGVTTYNFYANDFVVNAGVDMTLNTVSFIFANPANPPVPEDNPLQYTTIEVLEDDNGQPGNPIRTYTNIQPIELVRHYKIWGGAGEGEAVLAIYDLEGFQLPGDQNNDTRYWLSVKNTLDPDHPNFSVILGSFYTDDNSNGSSPMYYQNSVDYTWHISYLSSGAGPWEGAMLIDADCTENSMATSDLNSFDFSYYPNPVKDILTISTKKGVESISAFNLAGQQVLSNAKISNGQIDVSSLVQGTYVFRVTLEGGKVETFKIIKK